MKKLWKLDLFCKNKTVVVRIVKYGNEYRSEYVLVEREENYRSGIIQNW
jgi:hypothetical protein